MLRAAASAAALRRAAARGGSLRCRPTTPAAARFCTEAEERGQIIDGKLISKECQAEIQADLEKLRAKFNRVPGLAVVLVGERQDSKKYVGAKQKMLKKLGFSDFSVTLPENVSQGSLMRVLAHLNKHPDVHGILVQLPLPPHLNQDEALKGVDPSKDVDGFHPYNVGRLMLKADGPLTKPLTFPFPFSRRGPGGGTLQDPDMIPGDGEDDDFVSVRRPYVVPCTPKGAVELLDRYDIPIAGKRVCIMGRSNIVGLPLSQLMVHRDATVTICHSKTPNAAAICRESDILVGAIGKPKYIRANHVKPGAVVIDVGINVDPVTGKLCGDVDFEAVRPICSWITPVPGGVGPMTVTMLMRNTLENARCFFEEYLATPTEMRSPPSGNLAVVGMSMKK